MAGTRRPIPVEQVAEPTEAQVAALLQSFIVELQALFERHKARAATARAARRAALARVCNGRRQRWAPCGQALDVAGADACACLCAQGQAGYPDLKLVVL